MVDWKGAGDFGSYMLRLSFGLEEGALWGGIYRQEVHMKKTGRIIPKYSRIIFILCLFKLMTRSWDECVDPWLRKTELVYSFCQVKWTNVTGLAVLLKVLKNDILKPTSWKIVVQAVQEVVEEIAGKNSPSWKIGHVYTSLWVSRQVHTVWRLAKRVEQTTSHKFPVN